MDNKRAVLLYSGGIDSVCLVIHLIKRGWEVFGLMISYGQLAQNELWRGSELAHQIGLKELRILELDNLKKMFEGTTALVDQPNTNLHMPEGWHHTVIVPLRNAIFLSIAGAWAYSLKATRVAIGTFSETANPAYSDARPLFMKIMQSALKIGAIDELQEGTYPEFDLWNIDMADITGKQMIREGYEYLGDKMFSLTWSCFNGGTGKIHCGECLACRGRNEKLLVALGKDLTEYAKKPRP